MFPRRRQQAHAQRSLIHRSAWKVNSPKLVSTIVHSTVPMSQALKRAHGGRGSVGCSGSGSKAGAREGLMSDEVSEHIEGIMRGGGMSEPEARASYHLGEAHEALREA